MSLCSRHVRKRLLTIVLFATVSGVLFVLSLFLLADPKPVSAEVVTHEESSSVRAAIRLSPIVTASGQLTYLTHAGDGSKRLFLTEKKGRVLIVTDGNFLDLPFLDITELVQSTGHEQGLLSIAFSPDYSTSGTFYVAYTEAIAGDLVVARYTTANNPNIADRSSGDVILTVGQVDDRHNGGQLHFGPDGYLYVSVGDGGGKGDPQDNASNLNVLNGKILRLDVSGVPTYTIPSDNPFVDNKVARDEIWAYGLRNPWRFSFDRKTGALFIGDVGQWHWEELNFQPATSAGGEDYGWNTLEGNHCFFYFHNWPTQCSISGKVPPVTEYDHEKGCAITGGYVYRGTRFPAMVGTYIFGDFCSGRIWGLRRSGSRHWERRLLANSDLRLTSFGEAENGEIYALDMAGTVYHIQPTADGAGF